MVVYKFVVKSNNKNVNYIKIFVHAHVGILPFITFAVIIINFCQFNVFAKY